MCALVTAFAGFVFERDLSEADAASLMVLRGAKPRLPYNSFLAGEVFGEVDGVLGEDEIREFNIDIKKTKENFIDPAAHRRDNVGLQRREANQNRKPKHIKGIEFAQAQAKTFLPKVTGCAICLETVWHGRWKVAHPVVHPPCSTSATFPRGVASRPALLIVLRWVWDRHFESTGASCPWDLSE